MKKFGFVTCVQLGLACMETIYRLGGRLDLAVTLHDHLATKKSGRVYIDDFCASRGIDLLKAANVNDAPVVEAVLEKKLDWLFIIGWSQIARKELLEAPALGAIGIHPTLLPQGRGRAAIPWAILKGLPETGVTLFRLDEGVDTGDIIAQQVLAIASDETAATLYERVRIAHETLIENAWPDLLSGQILFRRQDGSAATQWPGRTPADGAIRPEMTSQDVDRLVRATTHPYPGAFLDFQSRRYFIWAGAPIQQAHVSAPQMAGDGRLVFPTADGAFEAVDWTEREAPAA
jgi:methionyl-tRNA formyltransferase